MREKRNNNRGGGWHQVPRRDGTGQDGVETPGLDWRRREGREGGREGGRRLEGQQINHAFDASAHAKDGQVSLACPSLHY